MKSILLLFFLVHTINCFAQSNTAPCACCSYAHKQFDFWLGNWDVYNTKDIKVGENNIIRIQDSCALQENWISPPQTGTSYNYFDTSDSLWHQLWIDNVGTVLNLKGKLVNGKMVLESEKMLSKKNKFYFNRITWQQLPNGNITQKWDIVGDSGQILQVAFEGVY
jgi:hypothetical protein